MAQWAPEQARLEVRSGCPFGIRCDEIGQSARGAVSLASAFCNRGAVEVSCRGALVLDPGPSQYGEAALVEAHENPGADDED